MKHHFNECPDCGEPYGYYGQPNFKRNLSVDYDDDLVVKNVIKAVCHNCYWETNYHDNVKECAEEWNSTVIE